MNTPELQPPPSARKERPRSPRVVVELEEGDAVDLLDGKVSMFARGAVAGAHAMSDEDVTGFTRNMVASAIRSALKPMIGEPITADNIEAVKSIVTRQLQGFYSANDVYFPLRIRVTAGRVREVLGTPTHVPEDATLWLLEQRVEVEQDAATRALTIAMSYDGEWRQGDNRWQASESETVMGLGLES